MSAVTDLVVAGLGSGALASIVGYALGGRQRKTQLADLETSIAERLMTRLDKELEDALADVARLSTEVAELRHKLEILGQREEQLVRENADLRAERDAARAQLADRERDLAAATASLQAKENEIAHLLALSQPAAPPASV